MINEINKLSTEDLDSTHVTSEYDSEVDDYLGLSDSEWESDFSTTEDEDSDPDDDLFLP